jgi:hypothetical protein
MPGPKPRALGLAKPLNSGALGPDAHPRALCPDARRNTRLKSLGSRHAPMSLVGPKSLELGGAAQPKRLGSDPSFYNF